MVILSVTNNKNNDVTDITRCNYTDPLYNYEHQLYLTTQEVTSANCSSPHPSTLLTRPSRANCLESTPIYLNNEAKHHCKHFLMLLEGEFHVVLCYSRTKMKIQSSEPRKQFTTNSAALPARRSTSRSSRTTSSTSCTTTTTATSSTTSSTPPCTTQIVSLI